LKFSRIDASIGDKGGILARGQREGERGEISAGCRPFSRGEKIVVWPNRIAALKPEETRRKKVKGGDLNRKEGSIEKERSEWLATVF